MDNEYFELVRAWIRKARDEETDEFGYHPCAPHEEHQDDECPELCKCGHTCREHVHLDGMRMYRTKPTAYICLTYGCECKMFEDQVLK